MKIAFYPSSLTDDQWALLEPMLPARSKLGRPPTDRRAVVDSQPGVVEGPFAEDVVNRLPGWKARGRVAPLNTCFDNEQDGVNNSPPVRGRPSEFGAGGKHRFKKSPLGVGKTGGVKSDFHRSDCGFADSWKFPKPGKTRTTSWFRKISSAQ